MKFQFRSTFANIALGILLLIFLSWMLDRPTLLVTAVCAGLAILLIGVLRYSVRKACAMMPAALVFVLAAILGR